MTFLLIALLLQSVALPPRTGLENPATLSAVPRELKKDYDRAWNRFTAGREDFKVRSDAEKLLIKNPRFDAARILLAYLDMYQIRNADAEQKFLQVLERNPKNTIALFYLAELAYGRRDHAQATQYYGQLIAAGVDQPDIEIKRQKALLLAVDNLIRRATQAEQEGRLDEAEAYYRKALDLAPSEARLHGALGALLLRAKNWDTALTHLKRQKDLGGESAENYRNLAEALMNLGRTEEAWDALVRLRQVGVQDAQLEIRVAELEDLGRWGSDIEQFRRIESAGSLSREQLSALVLRYFPQIMEFPQNPTIVTDVQGSWASPEIHTLVGSGLFDPFPNHTFQPFRAVTRSDLAVVLARLSRVLGLVPDDMLPIAAPDLAPGSAFYQDAQLVLGCGFMSLDEAGKFGLNRQVSGEEAVSAVERLADLFRKKFA